LLPLLSINKLVKANRKSRLGEEEFYDHDADPHEWTNLSASEAHVIIKKDHRDKLMTLLRDTKMPEGYR
jgi:hypothetical protein